MFLDIKWEIKSVILEAGLGGGGGGGGRGRRIGVAYKQFSEYLCKVTLSE